MVAPDPRVIPHIANALRALTDGKCPHEPERWVRRTSCYQCQAEAAYTAVMTFIAKENHPSVQGR